MTRTTFDIIVESMLGGSASLDADRYGPALRRAIGQGSGSQQRGYDEVADVVGRGPVPTGHVDRLVFCRQVISEAMRLYPAAPNIGRRRTSRWRLAVCGSALAPHPHSNFHPASKHAIGES